MSVIGRPEASCGGTELGPGATAARGRQKTGEDTRKAGGPTSGQIARLLVPALCFVVMTTAVMQTAVVPIIPAMSEQLGVGPTSVGWVLTANLLSAAVCTPVLSRLADQRGARPVMLWILAVVMVGSVLCVLTQSLPLLIAGRALQGMAFALFPIGVAILRGVFDSRRLSNALGLMSGILSVGGGVGLVAVGVIVGGGADYRQAFWLLVVLNLVAFGIAWALIPGGASVDAEAGFDVLGTVLLAIGLSTLLLALAEGRRWGWVSVPTLGLAIVGLVVSVCWYLHGRRARAPLVPPDALRGRVVTPTHLCALLVGAAMYVQFLGAAQFVQAPREIAGYGFDATVLRASLMFLLPSSAAGALTAAVSGRLVRRYRADRVLIAACAIGVVGFAALAFAHTQAWQVIASLIVINIFVSGAYAALPSVLIDAVPESETGVVNGVNAIARTFGSSLASALVATLMASFTVMGTSLASESAYLIAFLVGGISAGAAGLVVWIGRRLSMDKI